VALVHLDLAILQEPDHRLPGQPVEDRVGQRRVHLAILDEEDVGARRLGHVAAIIEEHRVRTAPGLGRVLGHGADHVESRRLGRDRDRLGARAFPLGDVEFRPPDLGIAVIAAPFPRGHRHADRIARGCHAHILTRAAERQHPDIGIAQPVGLQHRALGGLDLVHGIGDRHIHQRARFQQPLGMRAAFEHAAAIAALALEDRAGVVQRVAEDVHIGVAPVDELAVHPDLAVAVVIACHEPVLHSISIYCALYDRIGHKITQFPRFATNSILECQ